MSIMHVAARIAPPTSANVIAEGTLAAAATLAEVDCGIGDNVETFISIAVSGRCHIRFGATGIGVPDDDGSYPAGVYSFVVKADADFVRIRANEDLGYEIWRSSY